MMESKKSSVSRLFLASHLEGKDELEDRHERCFQSVQTLINEKSEKEANDALANAVSKDPKSHEDICLGLLIGILSEPEKSNKYFRDLTLVSRDGLQCVMTHLSHLVLDKYTKLSPQTKQQILWLTREMIKASVAGTEPICWGLMRQIAGGDVSRNNLWLADSLLDIFMEHRAWLEKFSFLLASVVYTYLRLLEDHMNIPKLREKEVKFVVSILREKFAEIMVIGRDLIRVLQGVARIPEIEQIWNDILHNPKSLSPTFTGITQLMHSRTSRRFLQSRVTPDMEKKLVFLTSRVRFGQHKRYQDWFQRQYLATQESQTLRCDLIRFIVGVIHPTNELLCSGIIPRWAVIGWLLTTCTNPVAASTAKLALFYDWLYFEPDKDNIMNIEPAILVMYHSMKPHPAITATLLDFLCRIITEFYPREKEKVRSGIYNSLRQILDKRVLQSLSPLFDNNKLDKDLRTMLRERFSPFVSKEEEVQPMFLEKEEEGGPTFSDDEDDILESDPRSPRKQQHQVKRESNENGREELDGDTKNLLVELKESEDDSDRCEIMDKIVENMIFQQFDFEQVSTLASKLAEALEDQFEGRIFPEQQNPEAIEDSIGKPVFLLFRSLCEMTESDPNRPSVLQLLAELYTLQPRVGYCLLYYLKANRVRPLEAKAKANAYKDLCETIDQKYSLDICLVNDMRQCQEDDVNLFVYLVPEVYTNFPKHAVGNVDLLYLVVSCIDGRQVQTLVCFIVAKDFIMFRKDSFQTVLNASLQWETFEQYALWQLLSAHDLPVDCIVPLLPELSYSNHSEALTSVVLLLKQEKPTAELVRHLLSREIDSGDRVVSATLTYWMQEFEEKLGELVSHQLCKQVGVAGNKRKRQGGAVGKNGTLNSMAEQTLMHLDQLRQTCKQYEFFNLRSVQNALQQVRNSCTESQKKKFSDLFALADSDSDDEPPKKSSKKTSKSPAKSKSGSKKADHSEVSEESGDSSEENEKQPLSNRGTKRGRGGKKPAARKRGSKVSYKEMESTDDSSEEEEAVKKTPKKKKKVSQSDSD